MVNDLLDLERLDRGMIEPECEPTDLGELARTIVGEADFLDQHPVRVESASLVLSVDTGKVERILENLLINASKHTPPGTPVVVRLVPDGDGALFSVEDEGPGIPDEVKAAIFEPFKQGEAATANKTGAGIGLSLVRKFTELHGGRAWVEDRPGGGTTFSVWFPGPILDEAPNVAGRLSAAASARASLL